MKPTLVLDNAQVFLGSCLDVLPTLADNSVDSVVCDPPYELGFMGKSWDASGVAYNVDVWRECLRVLKPGGHLLAFGGSRTWHRLAVAIEDAGFEMRDSIAWLYGSGFPKSHNISKAIDKLHGAERKVVGQRFDGMSETAMKPDKGWNPNSMGSTIDITEPTTDDAKAWDGWGTALKPAFEPIVVARKPLIGTVAENVLQHGTGGLNIDASRIKASDQEQLAKYWDRNQSTSTNGVASYVSQSGIDLRKYAPTQGRWPANIILDETTAELLDKQSGEVRTSGIYERRTKVDTTGSIFPLGDSKAFYNDKGGASRFFYVAKANKKDRNEGEVINTHPTVKPTSLMTYLIKLVTPPNGTVLDPFAGSGSTGKAALLEGFQFIGIELTEEYLPIIAGRLQFVAEKVAQEKGDDLFADL